MLKKLAGDTSYEEYDYDILFAFFRPEEGSPDYEVMMKFIHERRRGVTASQPDPLAFHDEAILWDYILLCSILALDEYFMEKLKIREEGKIEIDEKLKRADAYRMVELNAINRLFLDYHMKVVQHYPEFHLAFLKASELTRMLMKKEGVAFAKREEESEERGRAAMRIVEEEERCKVKMYFTRGNEVDELHGWRIFAGFNRWM